ncbi:HesB/YadR/YfhF family protein [Paraliobacillus sp. JSM ZJ581]|uniref:HesB/YadR/YfhF family protein n=1 Tax=Paraliobacillus sp. JSM ZJ581 TaxID=3342118 RepID=UPI0035A9054F
MAFTVTEEAAAWYINEMSLDSGDYVHFFVKLYGGIPTAHPNYFLGVSVGKDGEIGTSDIVKGITFYFTQQDKWFLEDFDLKVDMGEEEAIFDFTPIE